ncbi:cyclin-B1-2-like isoform X1 [Nymphaea colorata]|nr:cyclin-B1-2-like isoform X1 [Nymphaea colorata]
MEGSSRSMAHDVAGFHDTLRLGLPGVKNELAVAHPLQSLDSMTGKQAEMKRMLLGNTYGSAFHLRMDLDKQILSRFQRPSGVLPSSMVGLEALTGSLEDFGFEDYLNGKHIPASKAKIHLNQKLSGQWTCIMEWKSGLVYRRGQLTLVLSEEVHLIYAFCIS